VLFFVVFVVFVSFSFFVVFVEKVFLFLLFLIDDSTIFVIDTFKPPHFLFFVVFKMLLNFLT
jgi:hypothetical protein